MKQEGMLFLFGSAKRAAASLLISQLLLSYFVLSAVMDFQEDGHGKQAQLSPPHPLALKGAEVYMQEGCQYCHTQNLRPFAWEVKRFGDEEELGYFPLSGPMEYYFESPSLRGRRRIGPDLSRAASMYNEEQLRRLLKGLRKHKLKDKLHQYAHLFSEPLDTNKRGLSWKIRLMLQNNIAFSDNYQRSLLGTERYSRADALIHYLLSRGKKQMQFEGKYYRKE